MIVKLKINNSLLFLVFSFLSLFLCKSAASSDLFYEEEALNQIQHVQVSHGKTLYSLDTLAIVVLSLDMPLAIFLTRFAAVIDSFKTNSALQDCDDATHDNLSFLRMKQKGEFYCLGLESLCAAGYLWTESPVFFVATASLGIVRNLAKFYK